MRDNVWGGVLLCWTLIGPVAAGMEIVTLIRVKSAVRRQWREWLENPEPETELWLLEGDIRRMVARLPWRQWREKRAMTRELRRVTRYWEGFQRKLELVRAQLSATAPEALARQREQLEEKLARETDALTAESLRRQLAALEGEVSARSILEAWDRRLEAAREECALSLRHLRARLSLRAAGGDLRDVPVLQEAAVELQSINSQLAAADAAAEEVLQLGRG